MLFRDSIIKPWLPFLLVITILLLGGCKNEHAEQIQQEYAQVERNLDNLESQLSNKQLTNAKIVDIYARQLTQLKPEFRSVAEAMSKDASERGSLYQGLLQRLHKVNRNPENKQQYQVAHQSLVSIDMAADPVVFNDALLDLINTMAELSGGRLESVSIPQGSQAANVRGEQITPGSYLVGNPSYGAYQQDSSGRSFWQWYGQYAFFSRLMGGGMYNHSPIYYDRWNSGRSRYSYYNDYGRNAYGSRHDRNQTTQRNNTMHAKGYRSAKPKKQYGSVQGRQRVSTYSRQQSAQAKYSNKKYGSNNAGGRHAGKTVVAKRSSSYFSGNKTSARVSKPVAKRSSSFFGSSSARNSSRSRGFGGK